MSVTPLPEGVELDLKVYLVGMIESVETEIVVTLGGLAGFSDDLRDAVEVSRIVESQNLDKLGKDWRVMTRSEIADFKERERAQERETTVSFPL